MTHRPATRNHPLQDAAIGFAAGLAGSFAMDLFARIARANNGGKEVPGAAPGRDRSGRGMQPPQADGNAANDAAVRSGSAAYEVVTGHPPDPRVKPWLGSAAHYLFGASAGLVYGLLAPRVPSMRSAFGTGYGTLVWAIADEGVIPALGLSRNPRQIPADVHLYALAGHWVYGATLESFRRAAVRSASQRSEGGNAAASSPGRRARNAV